MLVDTSTNKVLRTGNGEGGIRTHEGVTPTRFRVVRNQPDSATSPCAVVRSITLGLRPTPHRGKLPA